MAEQPEPEPKSEENLPEPAQHSTADYEKFAQPEKPIRNWTKPFTIFIIVLVLLGAGTAAYSLLKNHKSTKTQIAPVAQTEPAKISSPTKSYTSPNLYLTFSYPANWTIVDSGGGTMTATSPTMQLKDAAGQNVSGKITMTIQTSAQTLPGFATGNATAAIASQKIAYTHPTQTQRADTYVSFLTYASTTSPNGLDAIYISADNGYTVGQAIPQADLIPVSPIISLTFSDKSGKAMTISANSWDDSSFSAPILAILESFSIT